MLALKTSAYGQPIGVAMHFVFIRFFGMETLFTFCSIQRSTQSILTYIHLQYWHFSRYQFACEKIEGLQPKPTHPHHPQSKLWLQGTIIFTNTKENEQHNLKHTSEPWMIDLHSDVKCFVWVVYNAFYLEGYFFNVQDDCAAFRTPSMSPTDASWYTLGPRVQQCNRAKVTHLTSES